MKEMFDNTSFKTSMVFTKSYSTSFSLGIRFLHGSLHKPLYSIYGFVRLGDEIVDSFHDYDKPTLLKQFKTETHKAIDEKISINPVIHSFQQTVNHYNIDRSLIDQFIHSMEMDLAAKHYDNSQFKEYVLGSAEVVGLMCLRVFCNGSGEQYNKLKPYAMSLGSAFQKINFLRDLNMDYTVLKRRYFPNVDPDHFDNDTKHVIISDIQHDLKHAYQGIRLLPRYSRFGVYLSYIYYKKLLKKISTVPTSRLLAQRVRISNSHKYALLLNSMVRYKLNIL
jgi:phytoene/squalene synthetase